MSHRLSRRHFLGGVAACSLAGFPAQAAPRDGDDNSLARMDELHVPGMSIARVKAGRVDSTRWYGMARREEGVPVQVDTRFQAASISKPVALLGALRLVAERRLSLDEPVLPLLRSWQPAEPNDAWRRITLRQLVTHSAGLGVHGFAGYAPGVPLPTVAQILDGVPPANSQAVRPDHPAGLWRYSGGGLTIVQMLMTDVTGRDFVSLVDELVLAPLGMRESSFARPASNDRRFAFGYDKEGQRVEGGWHLYPELAAAALWTTPSDLARFAIALLPGRAPGQLGKAAELLLTRAPGLDAMGGGFGHGIYLGKPGERPSFRHAGANDGYRCVLSGLADSGDAIVVMTNGDAGGALVQSAEREMTGA